MTLSVPVPNTLLALGLCRWQWDCFGSYQGSQNSAYRTVKSRGHRNRNVRSRLRGQSLYCDHGGLWAEAIFSRAVCRTATKVPHRRYSFSNRYSRASRITSGISTSTNSGCSCIACRDSAQCLIPQVVPATCQPRVWQRAQPALHKRHQLALGNLPAVGWVLGDHREPALFASQAGGP